MTEQKAERRAVDEVGGHPRSVAPGERIRIQSITGHCRMATETAQCIAAQADTAHSTALRPRNELKQSGTHARRESGQVRISMVLDLRLMRAAAARYIY